MFCVALLPTLALVALGKDSELTSPEHRMQIVLDSLCASGNGDGMHVVEKRISKEYICDGKKELHDAMAFACNNDCKSACCCAQICLPQGLWKIAQRHGILRGNCSAMGFTDFDYQASRVGVHYNVRALQIRMGRDARLS